jgi:hypothetical protein
MSGTAWDVTAVEGRDAWLAALLDDWPDPILILSADDSVEWTNAAGRTFTNLVGIPAGPIRWEALPQLRGQGLPALLARVRLAPGSADTTTVEIERPGTWCVPWRSAAEPPACSGPTSPRRP